MFSGDYQTRSRGIRINMTLFTLNRSDAVCGILYASHICHVFGREENGLSESVITIETPRMVLSTPTAAMAPEALDFYIKNRHHLEPWEPARDYNFYTLEYQRLLLSAHMKELAKSRAVKLWLRLKGDGCLIGAVNLNQIIWGVFRFATVGYKMDCEHTGRGLMTEALSAAVRLAFDDMNLHRLEAGVMPRNLPSKKVLEKAGFRLEGYSPQYMNIRGTWEDHEKYAVINTKRAD